MSERDDQGYPAISWASPKKIDRDLLTKYTMKWQCRSMVYSWRFGISGFLPEWYEQFTTDEICPSFTKKELEQIADIIRSEKIIPYLDYAPSELFFHTKRVWWIVPFCIWKDDTASFLFVDKNGILAMYKDADGEFEIKHIFPWEGISDLEFETMYDDDPNVNRLRLYATNGFLSFDEFVSDGEDGDRGSYLSVIEAIWLARKKTIEASSGEPLWYEGAGGEGFQSFEKPSDLLDKAKWEDPYRPQPFWYGYTRQTILEQEESSIEGEEYDEEHGEEYDEAIELLKDFSIDSHSESDRENYVKTKVYSGNYFRRKGQYPQAIRMYLEVLEVEPTHRWVRRNIALCYTRNQNYEEALKWYNQIIENDDNFHSRYMLGWIYLWVKKEYETSLYHLNKSIELNSDYADCLNTRGILYDMQGDHQKSLESFDRCVELDPYNLDYVWKRGRTLHKLSNYAASNKDLLRVIGSEPYSGYSHTHFEISVNYYELNEFSEALTFITKATELDSKETYHHHKAKIYEAIGEYKKAEESYKISISLNDEWSQPYYRLGLLYKELGRFDEAIENFKKAHEIYNTWVWAAVNIGRCYTMLGSNEEAIRWFDKALKMGNDLDWIRYDRGLAYHNAGLFKKAIEDYDKYKLSSLCWYYNIESARRQKAVYLGEEKNLLEEGSKQILVQALLSRGKKPSISEDLVYDFDRCFDDLTKAIELDPQNYEAFFERGVKHTETDWKPGYKERAIQDFETCISIFEYMPAYRELGLILIDTPEAIAYLKKAIALEPKDSENWEALGYAYFSSKNYDEALNAYTQAVLLNPSESNSFNLGKTYFELKQFTNALSYFEKAINYDSEYSYYYYYAALSSKELNKKEVALQHIQKSIKYFNRLRRHYIEYYSIYKELAVLNNFRENRINALQKIMDYHSAVVNAENYNSVPDSELEILYLKNYAKSLDEKETSSIFNETLSKDEFDSGTYTWFKNEASLLVKRHLLQNQNLSDKFSAEDIESMKGAIES